MKKVIAALIVGIAIGAGLILLMRPTGPDARKPKPLESSEKNSFHDVTARLNPSGSLYFYISTERLVTPLLERMEGFKDLVLSGPSQPSQESQEIEDGFRLVSQLIENSGLEELSGIGLSMMALEDGINHSKVMTHHYEGDDKGLMWNIFKHPTQSLDALDMLPSETALAFFNDFHPHYLWQWIKDRIGASGIEPLQRVTVIWDEFMKMQGIDLDRLLPSVDGLVGVVVALDGKKPVPVPIDGRSLITPDLSAAVLVSVINDRLFNVLKQNIPGTRPLENRDDKGFSIPAPAMPFTFEPVVVQRDHFLVIASNIGIIDTIWAAKKGRNRLTATEEFKRLAREMPYTGNGFWFVSPRFSRALTGFYRESFSGSGIDGEIGLSLMEVFSPFPKDLALYGVLEKTGDGLLLTSNHNMSLENLLVLPASVTTAIGAFFFLSYSQLPPDMEHRESPIPEARTEPEPTEK
ncbi:MAG: hypothetical protein GY940_29735 [bacterium]|nr:hypothetical protein [bacterium]